jgi:hypothetical protein
MSDLRFASLFSGASPKLVERFLKYHGENPELYKMFEKFAFDAMRSGRKRFSIWMIANRIRWYSMIETTGKEFKVSNDYLACYARFLIWKHPEFEGFFQIKEMKRNRTVPKD